MPVQSYKPIAVQTSPKNVPLKPSVAHHPNNNNHFAMPTAEILQAQISLLEQQIKMLNPMMPHLGMMPMMQNPAALQQQMLMQ